MPETYRVAVAGAAGYIGAQCVGLIARHPQLSITALTGRSTAGQRYCDAVPGSSLDTVIAEDFDPTTVDVVVACLPHTIAAKSAARWRDAGCIVVDLSADFRLRDTAEHERWYGAPRIAAELANDAVYALPELPWTDLATANVLAMPGCYATASILATAPALAASAVAPSLIVDAKSGVSGAGRSPSETTHFGEANESVRAYALDGHRHVPEIVQALRVATKGPAPLLTFVPHLIPMTRGILATAYLTPRPGVTFTDITTVYQDFCAGHPFLRLQATTPPTKSVSGTNVAALNLAIQGDTIIVTCAIDNLMKGAAGQAIQALNIRLGFHETTALPREALWP